MQILDFRRPDFTLLGELGGGIPGQTALKGTELSKAGRFVKTAPSKHKDK